MNLRRWRLAAGLVAVTLAAAACGGGDGVGANGTEAERGAAAQEGAAADAREVKIAYMGPLTGDFASVGEAARDAIQLAIDEAHVRGDLPVRLTLEVFDTQFDPAQAQQLTAGLIADASIIGVVGPLSSGEVKAAAPVLDDAGLAFVTVATNPDLGRQGWKSFHRLVANDDSQASEVARYIAEVLEVGAVSVIHDNTEYGKGLAMLTKAGLQERDVAVEVDVIDPKAFDYSAAVNVVKARRPEVVFYGGYYLEAGRLVKQLRDAGVEALFLSGDGAKDPGIAEGAGRAAEGVQVTCACADPAHHSDPAAQAFAATFQERFGRPPALYTAEVYDGATLLIDAIRRGGDRRDTLLKNLKTARVQGVTKTFSFHPDGEIGVGSVYVYEFRAGAFVALGTTAELTR